MEKTDKIVNIYETACKHFFGFLYPTLGAITNPFGTYGIDAKVYQGGKLFSVEEWKLNSHSHHRLEDMGKGILIEHKKFIELHKKSQSLNNNRKTPVLGVYRRFFNDAEVIFPATLYGTNELKQYYTEEWCEPNQWSNTRYLQKGYYIPLYAKDNNGENYWTIKPYNTFTKRVHAMILEERDNALNQI